ncbi:Stk1 family PASTA domain-containing Ser/Thr kinase [Clostridiaceae bacterium AF42-6]|nr:Stk1 family PASTA domain-containing Ser/Thr kinase [Clostridiaceae bacterium AF42-6]RHP48306.1 Stk1 family PASTA domain-containing Ser/Thr kinase [Clostridiaceae bacterium AF31-3BH]
MIKTGTILGDRYEILEKIGTGGMAEVFKGKDHKLNRYVAVKVLKEEFRDNDGFVKKFKEEAQAAAGLAHPNIVNVYDVGDENGIYYIVMELVEGITLKNYIERKGRLTIKEATSIAIQVSAGLEVAHNNHIVHRDIKPQNIIISREGKVKVTDFGIAKATTSQTTTSSAMGSVHYASPEQARGGYVDHRSDIYSLGIVMYEMVTGRVPFDGETAVTVAVKHLQEQMVPPSKYCPEIPYSLEQIIKKCTEKSPDRRYQDIGDLMADLKQSLVDPDGDFVQMVDLDEQAKTVIMTKGTTSKVKESRRVNLSKDEDEDEDDEEDDEDSEDDEDDDELSPTVERAMTIAGVVLAVIIVIIMLLLFSKVLGIGKKSNTDTSDSQQTEQSADEEDDSSSASQGNTVNMPSLLGKTYAEARTVLEELGLKIERGESEKSNQYSAGQIIAQSEESGNSVKVGTTVTVTLAAAGSTASSDGTSSTGSTTSSTTTTTTNSKVKVPSVVGKDENAAKSAITAAGLTVGTVSEASSDTVESGLVISQSPSANSETESGGKVNIVLSSGPNKKKVTDVIGHESSRAQSELAGDGFKVEVKETYSDDMRAGLVVSTSPDRGTYVQPGSTVTITVSKGREQVTIPSVSVGMTYEEAVEALNDAGFKGTVKEATEYSASVGNGFVTRYSPSKTVDPDGTVTIYVSLGTQSTTE